MNIIIVGEGKEVHFLIKSFICSLSPRVKYPLCVAFKIFSK